MFPNLRAEMARQKLTSKRTAEESGINERTFSNKMTGRYPFNHREMIAIRDRFFPNMTLDYLFETEEEANNKVKQISDRAKLSVLRFPTKGETGPNVS